MDKIKRTLIDKKFPYNTYEFADKATVLQLEAADMIAYEFYSLATSWRKNESLTRSLSIRWAPHFCKVVRIAAPKHLWQLMSFPS